MNCWWSAVRSAPPTKSVRHIIKPNNLIVKNNIFFHQNMLFFKKNKSVTPEKTTPKKQVIKVNPYENPENVMELMANICSATPSVDTDVYWQIINDAYNKEIRGKCLREYLTEQRDSLLNKDFDHELKDYCRQLSWNLTSRENTAHTQIVVAGGFSSGKSSFLNRISNSTNLLPTGTEPVSVVKTYLYCSRNAKNIVVKGVNQKNVLVNLDTGVLQAIQHASKSNIYLASVLDQLFVELPSENLDGLVFIDTPGYNNSDKENKSNGKTDKDTALEAMSEGNVLFWFIGSDRPTITEDDKDIIKRFSGRKVIIFNKADKHGAKESKKIVEDGARIVYGEFPKDEIIDIIAYSSLENKVYYSYNGMSITNIIEEAKKSGNGMSELNTLTSLIESLFDDEISASQNAIKNIEKGYSEKLDWKNESQKIYTDAKDFQDWLIDELNTVLVDSYSEVENAADTITASSLNALKKFCDFINAMYKWDNTDHECWTNTLTPIIDRYNGIYDKACDKHNKAIKYQYYNEEYRQELVKKVKSEENFVVNQLKDMYEDACKACEHALEGKNAEKQIIKAMQEYKATFMPALQLGIQKYQQQNIATSFSSEDKVVKSVFDCIKEDNYKTFLRAFEEGVDLAICNADGYSPLTLAVEQGNNAMVQFMLDHDADPSILDKRGYNAFHTAVENQYRDICKMILDSDPELINTKTSQGESVEDLANKDTFVKWIENEIDNAF